MPDMTGPTGATSRPERGPTLRRTWTAVIASFLGALVTVGAIAIGATTYQQALFARTTTALEEQMAAVIELELVIGDVEDPASGVMYAVGGPEQYANQQAAYAEVVARMDAAFDNLEAELASTGTAAMLRPARDAWEDFDADLATAPGYVASGEIFVLLQAGNDPFSATWRDLTDARRTLTAVRAELLADLHVSIHDSQIMQRTVVAVVIGAVVIGLLTALGAAQRMRRRVLRPIALLQTAARELHGADGFSVELGESVRELGELGLALSETAVSVRDSQDRLRDQALTDDLTGMPNRKAFGQALHARLADPTIDRVAVLFLDLDDFKDINDTMGHAAGDQLLTVVAERLRRAAPNGAVVARLGGDEFAMTLGLTDDPAIASRAALDALEALSSGTVIAGAEVDIACSIGLAISALGAGPGDAEELLGNADFAMYTAKRQGKNRIEIYAPGLLGERPSRAELRRDLSGAAARDELALHYQPVVDLTTGTLLGAEALVRWDSPSRGLLGPGEFIAVAEDTGAIAGIGAWVLDRACRDLAAHPERLGGWVSVNVSGAQLNDGGFVDIVRSALTRHGVQPAALVLELTEAAAVTNTELAVRTLQALRALGVRVALDDFGTGFSSLSYVADLPLDVIKIDRAFVADARPSGQAALEAIVTLGRRLGLVLIAEGIETIAELGRLRGHGEMAGQGYLLARPMPLEALTDQESLLELATRS